MLVIDLMHEFELGVWKALWMHLVRILQALGDEVVKALRARQVTLGLVFIHALF